MNRKHYDIAIIGAGLAGLSAAIRLKKKGKSVLLIEKNDTVGGKLQSFRSDGYYWDNGPSLFTEPSRIDELFELFGKNPRDYFNYKKIDESCRYFFDDNSSITLYSDKAKCVKELKNKVGEEDAENYLNYIKSANKDYKSVGQLFLNEAKPKLYQYLSPKFMKYYGFFISRKMIKSLNTYNTRQFKSEKLQLIFNRFGTYNGSNPYQMSGLYSMISALELNHGTFFPEGGMRSIVDGLYKLAEEEGVAFALNTRTKVLTSKSFFTFSSLKNTSSDQLICAMDHYNFKKNVLSGEENKHFLSKNLSTSGLVFYWGIDCTLPLGLHNIFFNQQYQEEFDSIFGKKSNYQQPTIYIHVSSTVNLSDAPAGGMNLFIMINTSAYDAPSEEYKAEMKRFVIAKIKAATQIDITDHIKVESHWDNSIIEDITGSTMGALYGDSSNSLSSTLKRQGNRDKNNPNLYYCGGTVHPGGGIPLVTRSAKIVSDIIP